MGFVVWVRNSQGKFELHRFRSNQKFIILQTWSVTRSRRFFKRKRNLSKSHPWRKWQQKEEGKVKKSPKKSKVCSAGAEVHQECVSMCQTNEASSVETFRCLTVQVGWELKIKHWCEQNGVTGNLDKCNLRRVRRSAPYEAGGRGIGREWEGRESGTRREKQLFKELWCKWDQGNGGGKTESEGPFSFKIQQT